MIRTGNPTRIRATSASSIRRSHTAPADRSNPPPAESAPRRRRADPFSHLGGDVKTTPSRAPSSWSWPALHALHQGSLPPVARAPERPGWPPPRSKRECGPDPARCRTPLILRQGLGPLPVPLGLPGFGRACSALALAASNERAPTRLEPDIRCRPGAAAHPQRDAGSFPHWDVDPPTRQFGLIPARRRDCTVPARQLTTVSSTRPTSRRRRSPERRRGEKDRPAQESGSCRAGSISRILSQLFRGLRCSFKRGELPPPRTDSRILAK